MTDVIAAIKGNGSGKGNAWTKDQIKLAVALKLAGAKRSQIADAAGHPVASVTYLFTRKLKPYLGSEAELFAYLEVADKEELISYAEAEISQAS